MEWKCGGYEKEGICMLKYGMKCEGMLKLGGGWMKERIEGIASVRWNWMFELFCLLLKGRIQAKRIYVLIKVILGLYFRYMA